LENHYDTQEAQPLFLGKQLVSAANDPLDLNPPYVVKGLLYSREISLLVGPPNIGKSSVVSCIAASISAGRAFGELRVKRAAVLYVAAEDPRGIRARAYGFFQNHAADIVHFDIYGFPVDLSNAQQMAQFTDAAKQYAVGRNAERFLIVFDTLNLCIGDSDENNAGDMSRVITNTRRLAEHTDAHVMIVHHTAIADDSRARGSSAMHGNVDTHLILRKVEDKGEGAFLFLTQKKVRSAKKGNPLVYQIDSFEVGTDDDGDVFTVPIALHTEPTSSLLARAKEAPKPGGEAEARAMEVMRVLAVLRSKVPSAYHQPRVLYGMVGEGFEAIRANSDTLRKAVRRALDALLASAKVETDGNGGYRAALSADQKAGPQGKALH
jgi:hypothetical protein